MRIFALLSFCCLALPALHAQTGKRPSDTIFLSKIRLAASIAQQAGFFADSSGRIGKPPPEQLPGIRAIPSSSQGKLDPHTIGHCMNLVFVVCNDLAEEKTMFVLPGFYVDQTRLFKDNPQTGRFEPVAPVALRTKYNEQMGRLLKIGPGETGRYLMQLHFIKTTVNRLQPVICFDYYIPQLLSEVQHDRRLNIIITYMVCGIMLMMIFYSLAGYYTNRSIDFIYYASYSFLLAVMFFFKAFFYRTPLTGNYFFESYLDFMLQGIGIFFYFLFLQTFLQTKSTFPLLHAIIRSQKLITIAGLVVFTLLHFFTDRFVVQNMVENLVKYAWSFSTIFLIGYAVFNRSAILHYVAIGHFFLFLGGLLSLFLINSAYRFSGSVAVLVNDSLFWYEMGVLFELVFFLVALSYKNKQDISARAREKERLLMAVERESIERKMAVLAAQQEERNRISADMHDELGSGITAIRLLSELVKAKMKDNTAPEIEKISQSANELIGKMNTIIWTMKSANDRIDNLIAYVRNHAAEFFDNTDITCQVLQPDDIPAIEISGEKRRNIYLCIKEALNNIAKHAKASHVTLRFSIGNDLHITIQDNGIGMDTGSIRLFSNGIANMRKRMERISGSFSIDSGNQGTVISLTVPLGE